MNLVVDSVIRSAIGCIVAISFVLVSYNIGPSIEKFVSPVVKDTKAVSIPFTGIPASSENSNHVAVTTTKVMTCKLEDTSVAVYRSGVWTRGTIFFKDPKTGELVTSRALRPAGPSTLDEIYVFPAGERVRMELIHSCHPFWNLRTILFDIATRN
jgi:hypothetical protein